MQTKKNLYSELREKSEFLQRQINVSFLYLLMCVTNKNSLKSFYSNSPIKDGSFWPADDWSQEMKKWATNYEDGDGTQERRTMH